MSRKRILPVVLLMLMAFCLPAEAQQYYRSQQWLLRKQRRSNFNVTLGGGASSLLIDSRFSQSTQVGLGARMEAGYTFLWHRSAGIHTGLGITYSHSGFAAQGAESSDMGYIEAYNNEHSTVRRSHYTSITDAIDESFHSVFLAIPLQLALQDGNWWGNIGFRLYLPLYVVSSYDYGETVVGAGYEMDGLGSRVPLPVETDRLPAASGSYTLSTLLNGYVGYHAYVTLSAEGGYRLPLDEKRMLYLGLFIDYALNQTAVGGNGGFVRLDDGIPVRQYAMQSNLAGHLRYVSFGFAASYQITFGHRIGHRRSQTFAQPRRKSHGFFYRRR